MIRRLIRPSIRPSVMALAVLSALVFALGVTACSNTQSAANRQPHTGTATASAVDGVQQVVLDVGSSFRFDPSTITVHPGKVRIILQHASTGAPHNWQLTGIPGAYVPSVGSGQSASVTFVAPAPGSYTFVCTIHERQGQTGTLIVLSD